MNTDDILEYRIGHLRERLAREDAAELGLLVEAHGAHAVLRGRVADEEARGAVLRAAGEELAGLDRYADLTVCQARPPGPGEAEEVVT